MKTIVSAKKLPEEHEKEIRSLLQKSFNLSNFPSFNYCFTAVLNNEVIV
jgi:F0F1-type ATP synthase delta subunit